MSCPFCRRIADGPLTAESTGAVAFADAYPVSRGHTLVVPRRHVEGFFSLDLEQQADVWQLVAAVRELLVAEQAPDGFTVGVNDGTAAGQTVAHAHVHVIPRYRGDAADPRGGIRGVIPERAAYWDRRP
jgi:diadenosine tetraphosphate (Ap4A) HIT family hydrolase